MIKGRTHFKHQRYSALSLVVLALAFVFFPQNLMVQGLLLILALYHALLGIIMVIEDYVRKNRSISLWGAYIITASLMACVTWRIMHNFFHDN